MKTHTFASVTSYVAPRINTYVLFFAGMLLVALVNTCIAESILGRLIFSVLAAVCSSIMTWVFLESHPISKNETAPH